MYTFYVNFDFLYTGQPFNSPQDLIQAIQALGQMTIDTDTTVKTPYSPQVQSQSQATNPFRFNFGNFVYIL